MDDLNVQHENVYMRLFVQSLEGEPSKSFRSLAVGSINTWQALESWFHIAWGEKKYYQYFLSKFSALKKTETENIESFSRKFNKAYNKLPVNIKPLEAAAMVYYSGAFPNEFSIMLRERRSQTLLQMQGDAVALEGNLLAGGKIKQLMQEPDNRNRNRNQEQRKPREETQKTVVQRDPNEGRMEEMSRALKSITQKMSRLKSDPNVPAMPPPRNAMGYRRPNNPQFLQRDRRNDDQNIQTPVRKDINNLEQEEEYIEEFIPVVEVEPEDENLELFLDQGSPEIYLTREGRESPRSTLPIEEHEKFGVSEAQY